MTDRTIFDGNFMGVDVRHKTKTKAQAALERFERVVVERELDEGEADFMGCLCIDDLKQFAGGEGE